MVQLSDELISAILLHEILSQIEDMRKEFDELGIINVSDQVFNRANNELVELMNTPFEPDALRVLSEIQETEIGTGFELETIISILNVEAFDDIIENDNKFVTIFNKLVFDGINESLKNMQGKKELPWVFSRNIMPKFENLKSLQNEVEKRMLCCNGTKAGLIFYENYRMSEVMVLENREQGIIKALTQEIYDDDGLWNTYDNEETQAKLDLADMVLELTIEEIIDTLFS